ncbi:MAG TPA: 3-methyl-2-oxobutanoate hydroxymethyltransferase [Phycisphaeraceae bacterium]
MQAPNPEKRITLRDLRRWARAGQKFAVLTCYDATTARWLWRGGVQTMLVGDTAAQMILGHDSTLPATMPFMLEITAAVRRGAPQALVIADMPFGSYQCGDDEAVRNAMAFMVQGQADLVKLEVDASHAPLVERLSHAGVPVVAHLGSRPQMVRASGGYRAAGRRKREADILVDTAALMIQRGAAALLVEAVPDIVSQRIVAQAVRPDTGEVVPVIGCGAGPDCHGHVVVLHDLLKLSDWQPPFASPLADLGQPLQEAAAAWVKHVESGDYLKDGGPYRMEETP